MSDIPEERHTPPHSAAERPESAQDPAAEPPAAHGGAFPSASAQQKVYLAIDKEQTKQLLAKIESMFESELLAWLSLPAPVVAQVRAKIMGPALAELHRLVDDARPPAFYLLGQSGHGKSSLLNLCWPARTWCRWHRGRALHRRDERVRHPLSRPPRRVAFLRLARASSTATTPPSSPARTRSLPPSPTSPARWPNVALHVLTPSRSGRWPQDVQALRLVQAAVVKQRGASMPLIAALTHPDSLGDDVTEWPP